MSTESLDSKPDAATLRRVFDDAYYAQALKLGATGDNMRTAGLLAVYEYGALDSKQRRDPRQEWLDTVEDALRRQVDAYPAIARGRRAGFVTREEARILRQLAVRLGAVSWTATNIGDGQ